MKYGSVWESAPGGAGEPAKIIFKLTRPELSVANQIPHMICPKEEGGEGARLHRLMGDLAQLVGSGHRGPFYFL